MHLSHHHPFQNTTGITGPDLMNLMLILLGLLVTLVFYPVRST